MGIWGIVGGEGRYDGTVLARAVGKPFMVRVLRKGEVGALCGTRATMVCLMGKSLACIRDSQAGCGLPGVEMRAFCEVLKTTVATNLG